MTRKVNHTTVALDTLVEDPNNPNHMTEDQLALLARAIQTAGFLQPVLIRASAEGGTFRIIDGHHRARAARVAGLVEVPCVVIDSDDDEAAILQIGMNRLRGELDLAEVSKVITDLVGSGWTIPDLTLTGFTDDELDALCRAAQPDEEDVLAGGLGQTPSPASDDTDSAFVLTLSFESRKDLNRAKRGLAQRVLPGAALSDALLALLDRQDAPGYEGGTDAEST